MANAQTPSRRNVLSALATVPAATLPGLTPKSAQSGRGADAGPRENILEAAAEGVAYGDETVAAVLRDLIGLRELRTFESFGARGDVQDVQNLTKGPGGTAGAATDDTAAIQAALDWVHGGTTLQPRALLMGAKCYLVGPLTLYPNTTIIGTGRTTSAFVCKPGVTGKWISDRGNGAQKIMLSGFAAYGCGNTALTHILELGDEGYKFGTQGILADLWLRDAPNGYAYAVNGNVGFFRNLIGENCRCNGLIVGEANHATVLCSMQTGEGTTGAIVGGPAEIVGLELYGCHVDFIEIEATVSGALPLRFLGDCHISNLIVSTAMGASHSHLIEVDETEYSQWSLRNLRLIGETAPITNGLLKRTPTNVYIAPSPPSIDQLGRLNLVAERPIYYAKAHQNFGIRLVNRNGAVRHQIGRMGDPESAGGTHDRINGATHVATGTPIHGGAFAAGISIDGSGRLVLDTANQDAVNGDFLVTLDFHNTGSDVYPYAYLTRTTVDGATRVRPVIGLRNSDGLQVSLVPPPGKVIKLGFRGTLE